MDITLLSENSEYSYDFYTNGPPTKNSKLKTKLTNNIISQIKKQYNLKPNPKFCRISGIPFLKSIKFKLWKLET